MWGVDPRVMCRKHLMGEHLEIHRFVGHMNLGKQLGKFITHHLIEVHNLRARHDALVEEMRLRGYKHQSPLAAFRSQTLGKISPLRDYRELRRRCPECREKMNAQLP